MNISMGYRGRMQILPAKVKGILVIVSLLFLNVYSSVSQAPMPAAITISPANATGWDQLTITYDPSKGCTPNGNASMVGASIVKMHAAAFTYDNIASWPSWGQYLVNFDQTPNDGIHTTTDFTANGDGTYSMTLVPAKYFGVPAGKIIIGISLVFNDGSWAGANGKDFVDGVCGDFHVPLKYRDPNHQATQAFKYQAVARNASNDPIVNTAIAVRISILQGSSTGPVSYSETQNPTTNAFGLFSLEIGRGTPVTGTFSAIDWSTGAYYINTEIDPSNGTNFSSVGVSELLSVPYAIYAENAGSTNGSAAWNDGTNSISTLGQVGIGTKNPGGMLAVQGSSSLPVDSALFSVKDKTGFTVFAIYEGGAELFIKPGAKGAKGGFTVGGRDPGSKSGPLDILQLTPDSVRITLNNPAVKGAKGGFTVGGRDPGGKGAVADFTALTKENYFIGYQSGSMITTGLYNSVLGYQSGINLTSGSDNSFIGYQGGYSNMDGSGNLFLGYQSGFENSSGNYNSFLGYKSGFSNTIGKSNTFLGSSAGLQNTSGSYNAFVGDSSGISNTYGLSNSFLGTKTGMNNIGGSYNVFIGNKAGFSNDYGHDNIFMGDSAGFNEKGGLLNIYMGNLSGFKSSSPWGNIFIGYQSGYNNTMGGANVFVGAQTGFSNTTAVSNTFVGIQAGFSVSNGCCNTFMGDHAGYYPKWAQTDVLIGAYAGYDLAKDSIYSADNVFLGYQSGYNSVAGGSNVFVGTRSGFSNTNSYNNVFIGYQSGFTNQTGAGNVFVGRLSGSGNTSGYNNVIIGNQAGIDNTTGFENVIIGNASGTAMQNAAGNVMIGTYSGAGNISGDNNVFVGMHTAQNSAGAQNTIVGAWAGADSTLGTDNVFLGYDISRHSTGSRNTYIGNYAGFTNVTGTDNVFIGFGAGWGETGSKKLIIANSGTPTPLVYGKFDSAMIVINGNNTHGKNFWVNGTAGGNTTWANLSDARLKKNIVNIPNALQKVLSLNGVNFEWIDAEQYGKGRQIGFIAQQTEQVVPELVNKGSDGLYTMKYAEVNALLVEAIKEQQKKIESLDAENKKLRSDVDQLKSLQDQINELKSSLQKGH